MASTSSLSFSTGYAPGFRTVELTDLEKLLKTIEHDECLATLKKVISNTAQAPTEAKFRKLKLTTPKVKELIVDVPGAIESLLQFGWVQACNETLSRAVLLEYIYSCHKIL